MPRQKQPWTAEEQQRRESILAAAKQRGLSLAVLAAECGASPQRMQRWSAGTSHLRPGEMEVLEQMLAAPSQEPAGHLQSIAAALAELAQLAGEPEDSPEKDTLRALISKLGPAAVGGLVKLAVSARSERVRLAAISELLDRGFGRPVQAYVDKTPRAPASEDDLATAILRAIEGAAAPAPVTSGDAVGEPASVTGEPAAVTVSGETEMSELAKLSRLDS